jgi:hypothetical protein
LNNPNITSPYNKNSYPFTGNGFTSGKKGTLGVPEWRTEYPSALELEDGAELYVVDNIGNEIKVGTYNKTLKKFVTK